ncbi:Histone deacetylase complex, catalytic component RPD3, partial [Pseudoloma neurophilia]
MKIAYSFDKDVGNYHYGKNHPMKPHRSTVVNSLIHSYGLDKHMDILEIETNCLDSYHNDEKLFSNKIYNDDCPHFPGLKEFCSKYTNGTLLAANSLLHYDIAINWSGGMHHGKKNEPSGFCYKNDIVIAIQRLLKSFDKVLYIDIDIHHGDAVEEAFGFNERVLTCSFHKYGDGFFPGTGTLLTNYFSKDKLTTDSNTIDIKDLKSEYPFVKK